MQTQTSTSFLENPKSSMKIKELHEVHKRASRRISGQSDLSVSTLANAILALEPAGATGAYKFRWDYLRSEILSKYDGSHHGASVEEKHAAAVKTLLESEASCKRINTYGYGNKLPGLVRERLLSRTRDIIWELLGRIPRDLFESASFSGGATTQRRRAQGDPYYKYSTHKVLGVTSSAYAYAYALITATPLWCASGAWGLLKIDVGNDVFMVNKNADTFRAAAKESCMNNCLQRAVGSYIRDGLKSVGIDLNDQTRNQRLAEYGSLTGSLATIDLKAASGSISCYLVNDLLALPWSELLNDLRSTFGTLKLSHNDQKKTIIKWEQHSTMGNGYTFELESLIFYAATKACIEFSAPEGTVSTTRGVTHHSYSVYGDDIICPTYAAPILLDFLSDLGFTPNQKKTFIDGPFRESCGKHYYNGYDVSPFYIRSDINDLNRVIWLLNALRAWASRCDELTQCICDPSVMKLWHDIRRKYVPSTLLGGKNVSSITSVASPENPRFCFGLRSKRMKIDGAAAVLRCFQYRSKPQEFSAVKWYELPDTEWGSRVHHGEPLDMSWIVSDPFGKNEPTSVTICNNVRPLDNIPLFPQEIVLVPPSSEGPGKLGDPSI